jgi:hypothetical protein
MQYLLDRLPEAEFSYRKALELSPSSETLHYWLGSVLLARNQAEASFTDSRGLFVLNVRYRETHGADLNPRSR